MKHALLIIMIILGISISGCSDEAEELFEIAVLEELQDCPEHTEKLYREIIERYPESKYAEEARERLYLLENR